MAAVLRELPTGGSKFAETDREMLTLVCAMTPPGEREQLLDLLRPLTEPEAVARGQALYRRLDELADASPGDPRVAPLAADLAAHIPEEMASLMVENLDSAPEQWRPPGRGTGSGSRSGSGTGSCSGTRSGSGTPSGVRGMEEVFAEMPPAQAEVFRLAVAAMAARAPDRSRTQDQTQDRSPDGTREEDREGDREGDQGQDGEKP